MALLFHGCNATGSQCGQLALLIKLLQVSLPTQYNGRNQDPVGALSSALARLQANRPLRELREVAKGVTKQLPNPLQEATAKIDEYARGMISGSGSTLFEELGLYYIGPVDGHSMSGALSGILERIIGFRRCCGIAGGVPLGPEVGGRNTWNRRAICGTSPTNASLKWFNI
jgi:hypothetical protein